MKYERFMNGFRLLLMRVRAYMCVCAYMHVCVCALISIYAYVAISTYAT